MLMETLAFLPGRDGLGCSELSPGNTYWPRAVPMFVSVPVSASIIAGI